LKSKYFLAENNQVMILLVRITVYRNDGGYYLPQNNSVSYLIHAVGLKIKHTIENKRYEVDLYKDFLSKATALLCQNNNKIINITGSIYANENGLDNCLLLNDSKMLLKLYRKYLYVTRHKLITPQFPRDV
jgi:branched-chain amino acid aminotransferase